MKPVTAPAVSVSVPSESQRNTYRNNNVIQTSTSKPVFRGWGDLIVESFCSLCTENYYTAAILIIDHNIQVATDGYRCTEEA